MAADDLWIVGGRLLTPLGVIDGAIRVVRERIAAIRRSAPRGARAIRVRGALIAPGFIDLHVWGEPQAVSREAVRDGTTAFVIALPPESPAQLRAHMSRVSRPGALEGAQCLGAHLEGPFVNSRRAGALPKRWMRRPTLTELRMVAARGRIRMVTLAPELPGAIDAIRWCRRRGILVSLGHTEADEATARRAVTAGASAVTHIFNGMPPFHHRSPGALGVALTDPRLTAMVIADGVHTSPAALQLLWRAKGVQTVALVTDSVRHLRRAWSLNRRGGTYYTAGGTLAGSGLTMIHAVRNMVELAGSTLVDAVRMASAVPAALLGEARRGRLAVGARADLVAFDPQFRVQLTMVGGTVVYERR